MKRLSIIFILLISLLMGVASCGGDEEPIGSWERMKWTNVNNLMNIQGVYYLPVEGGSYTFLCRNYSHPWINSVTVNGITLVPDIIENRIEFNGEWFTAKFEDNKLIITADALPQSVSSRNFTILVTAGDIGDSFEFAQQQNIY